MALAAWRFMIELEEVAGGVVISAKAVPGDKRNGVHGCHDGMLRVSVVQVAEKGKANSAIRIVLAKDLGVKKSQVSLVSGDTNRNKRFLLAGVDATELRARIDELLKAR